MVKMTWSVGLNIMIIGMLVTTFVFDLIKGQGDTAECRQECKWNRLQFLFVVLVLFAMASDFNTGEKKPSPLWVVLRPQSHQTMASQA